MVRESCAAVSLARIACAVRHSSSPHTETIRSTRGVRVRQQQHRKLRDLERPGILEPRPATGSRFEIDAEAGIFERASLLRCFLAPTGRRSIHLPALIFCGRAWQELSYRSGALLAIVLPALAAFGLYAPVHVEERMIAAFSVLLWLGLFAAVRVQNKFEIRRVSSCAAAAVAVFVIFSLANSVLGEAASHGGAELKSWTHPKANPQWQVAEELHRAGVHATDKVAWIRPAAFDRSKQNYGWARLARVRIIAEIPSSEADTFWSADSGQRSAVFNALARTGAVALVVTKMPADRSTDGWTALGKSNSWAYFLQGGSKQ